MAGLKSNEVHLEPYDAAWPEIFSREASALRAALGPLAMKVEHIGSTAVAGMIAKPIIDIAIKTESFNVLPQIIEAMRSAGYESKGEFGLPGRQFFTKGDPTFFHVHVVERQSGHWPRWISFRDALRANGLLRAEYEKMKRDLAAKFENDRPSYTAAKTNFIEEALSNR